MIWDLEEALVKIFQPWRVSLRLGHSFMCSFQQQYIFDNVIMHFMHPVIVIFKFQNY